MDIDLNAIEVRAKAATPGKRWARDDGAVFTGGCPIAVAYAPVDGELIADLAPQTVLALVARAREVDRLEEERNQAVEDRRILALASAKLADGRLCSEQRARNIADEGLAVMDAALVAERAESTRLRAVVEKLRKGLEPFSKCSLEAPQDQGLTFRLATQGEADYSYGDVRRARDLLAETAPDVPADQDGRVG